MAEAGKLNLGYSSKGKLQLAYQPPQAVQGKLHLSYATRGKLQLCVCAKETFKQAPTVQSAAWKTPPAPAKTQPAVANGSHKEPRVGDPVSYGTFDGCTITKILQAGAIELKIPNVGERIAVQGEWHQIGYVDQDLAKNFVQGIEIDVSKHALSGDGTVENVGIKLDAHIQCKDCRQRFISAQALNIHWRFIHDPNRHQED